MRVEQPQLFLYGVFLVLCVWGIARAISLPRVEIHLRAISLALGLGFVIVPGHGEFVVAPVLAALTPPLRSHLVILGSIFFAAWWAAIFIALKRLIPDPDRGL